MSASLTPFFNPRGVVVVGASTSPEKLGYGAARNLVYSGYKGAIHFVSQKTGELFNRPLYTDLSQVPEPVDLAILIVPAPATPETLEACGQRGIQAAIVVASGFREAGLEGAALEARCLEVAREHSIRMVGPNCIGSLDTHLPLDTTFLAPPMPVRGHIGFVSHSGAFCAAIIDWARNHGFGFSRLISLGNQADVNETDMLPVVAADEHTHVIVLYLEGVGDGRRFVEVAREVTRQKPVIALKVGRFESGQRAAASHTGALAGSDRAYAAAFEKAGIFRADSAEEMFDWAQALAACPLPRGRNVAVLTNAGGPGVIAADALEVNGLHMADLSAETEKALAELLPPAASVHNPVDMLASASPSQYADCLTALLADSGVDAALVILPPPPMYKTEEVADVLIPIIHKSDKPILVALLGSELTKEAAKHFQRADVPTYTFPEKAASALGILARRAEYLTTEHTENTETNKKDSVGSVISVVNMSPEDIVAAYGIPTAPMKLATSPDEATEIAHELGFPLVMKVASPDILHKSDIGGVLLDITSEHAAHDGYTQLVEKAKVARPNARIEGVHLQRQVPEGQEVILGAVQDPQFGPLIMFGSGGVEVEGLKDVAFALGPLTQAEAESMMRKTWAGRKLDGYRNISPADRSAVADALVKLSKLAIDHPEIAEIEINPLRVLAEGVVAIDIRVK
ncbi:MAG: acetate--CoA ligase family protein [Gammaproteobacteria bacterium]|jgi:acetyltransferase